MNILIRAVVAVFSLSELLRGESNPYKKALIAMPWESEQAFVTVRPGAHMFYWLYYADGTKIGAESKPLIIWIEGGPGWPASGIANFAEIGPFNLNMEPRNHTWVKGRNVLLIDHPVGTGFSYVNDNSRLAKTDAEIVTDLLVALRVFFNRYTKFRKTPTYLFGQNYGSKICPRLAHSLHKEIKKESVEMNLIGIGIGGFLDVRESILVYPELLYNKGIIDQNTYMKCTTMAKTVSDCIDKQDYSIALEWEKRLYDTIELEAGMAINYLNINKRGHHATALMALQENVNTYVKPMLSDIVNQTLEWQFMAQNVCHNLNQSLIKPSTKFLELLLNETEIKVAIYNGVYDAITPIAGASNLVHKLKWNGSEEFKNANHTDIRGNNGFFKATKQLSFWWVLGSGHWVPEDNPVAMEHILEYVISGK